LRYACLLTCKEVIRDASGQLVELRCTWDPASLGGTSPDGRTVKGTLHWVSAAHALPAKVRLYDRLFKAEFPEGNVEELNPQSLETLDGCKVEPYLKELKPGARYQFERLGYFIVDKDGGFNRTVTLKDSWAKIEGRVDAKLGELKASGQGSVSTPKKAKQPPPAAPDVPPPLASEIGIEEFQKPDLRVGVIREASAVEEAKKLIKLQVDVGEGRLRQIFAGLRAYYPDPSVLVGKKVIVVANLKPRQMKFGVSEGMVLAAGGGERPHRVATFDAGDDLKPGDKIA
jgi:methionine--tRNA ligase beta chain